VQRKARGVLEEKGKGMTDEKGKGRKQDKEGNLQPAEGGRKQEKKDVFH